MNVRQESDFKNDRWTSCLVVEIVWLISKKSGCRTYTHRPTTTRTRCRRRASLTRPSCRRAATTSTSWAAFARRGTATRSTCTRSTAAGSSASSDASATRTLPRPPSPSSGAVRRLPRSASRSTTLASTRRRRVASCTAAGCPLARRPCVHQFFFSFFFWS